jgi:hypothetical protein
MVKVGDRVRLAYSFDDLPAGREGVVFGFYRRDERRQDDAVTFSDGPHVVPESIIDVASPPTQADQLAS